MKIKEGYVLKEVAGSNVVLPLGEASIDFNGMASLNDAGVLLFKKMQEDVTEEDLVKELTSTYDIDEETAKKDVDIFVNKLKGAGIVE